MKRILKFFLIALIAVLIGNVVLDKIYSPAQVKFGVTFSRKYAEYLKLDWQKTYLQILDELKVKNLRIPGYWDVLEPEKGEYDFSEIDFMLDEANKRQAKVILVLGMRQPRWPECHLPTWAKQLTVSERQNRALQFIEQVVQKYKDHPAVWAWQVENEPLLAFGENCDAPDKDFLRQEVALVRSLSSKPIIMTDSGELGLWVTSMKLSDIFGTTLYRQVYDKYLGHITYPLPSYFYSIKSNLVRSIFAPGNNKAIIVELQAEPWLANGVFGLPEEQIKKFTIENFKNYISFAKKTQFDETYLWGVEWWYFMAANGYPEYLEYARTLF
ncbi:beta-galactosidase [Candidatus Daviesbacteria bacterium]|nr:beta-galactosidase [Candidatus Daviesbacteria bacterium]